MSKKSIDKNLLFEAIGEVKDEWIEKAVDYKRTDKIISFPFLKYVNMAAALIICIISVTVFVRLEPINELEVPEPTVTSTVSSTDELDNTSDVNTQMPSEDNHNTELPVITDTEKPVNTKKPGSIIVKPTRVPIIQTSIPSMRPISGPTKAPDIVQTKEPSIIVRTPAPSKEPVNDNVVRPTQTREPDIVTSSPMLTVTPGNETERPIQTTTPDISTETPEPPLVIRPTQTPMITAIPTDPPRKTPNPSLRPTPTPVVVLPTLSPMPTLPSTPTPRPEIVVPVPTYITEHNAYKYAVKGSLVVVEDLNGASEYSGDPNGSVFTFTDENAKNRTGIRIENPIAGKEEYVHDYGYLRDLKVEGLTNVFDLTGSVLGWGRDEDKLPIPSDQLDLDPYASNDKRVWNIAKEDEIYYPLPRNLKGFSMSFWSKTEKANDNSAILVFANTNRTVSISVNAEAKFIDAMDYYNIFSTSQLKDRPNYTTGKWHYYTITFANDWICVYIDGVEVKYDYIVLERDRIGSFNNGFLTRYNTAVTWTEEDYVNDWRGYLRIQKGSSDLYQTFTSDEYTVFGSGRYGGRNNVERLMLTFMAGDTTEVYLGGAVVEAGAGSAKYSSKSGSQIAQVKFYPDELTWEQVYANYLLAEEPVTE